MAPWLSRKSFDRCDGRWGDMLLLSLEAHPQPLRHVGAHCRVSFWKADRRGAGPSVDRQHWRRFSALNPRGCLRRERRPILVVGLTKCGFWSYAERVYVFRLAFEIDHVTMEHRSAKLLHA